MSVFYVFQGETYSIERSGGYVWSPKLDNAGHKNAGYTTMTHVKKGDFILHNSNGKIMSISVAKGDCYDATQPGALVSATKTVSWANDGYRIDCDYNDFDIPVVITKHKDWLKDHYDKDSAFTVNGTGKQQYMCHLADEHAIFILNTALAQQKNKTTRSVLKDTLDDILDDKDSEYNKIEMDAINEAVEDSTPHTKPTWSGKREAQAMTTSAGTGREKPKRDPQRAADALEYADYLCEYDNSDRTFLRKNSKSYTEPHHLIPICKYNDFTFSVDVMENIVSLCSHCHNLLHYGRPEDKAPILEKLYNDRITALRTCGLELTFDQLKSYYR
jgi:5-methylcytosine-specific restriction endonuclease McrA